MALPLPTVFPHRPDGQPEDQPRASLPPVLSPVLRLLRNPAASLGGLVYGPAQDGPSPDQRKQALLQSLKNVRPPPRIATSLI
jgi:hypothetical protein